MKGKRIVKLISLIPNAQEKSVVIYIQVLINVFTVNQVLPTYADNAKEDTDGRMILRDNFDAIFYILKR
jgi:hypothetical protein